MAVNNPRYDIIEDRYVYPDGSTKSVADYQNEQAKREDWEQAGYAVNKEMAEPRNEQAMMQLPTREPIQIPTLGRIVLINTYNETIGGQNEHAAIITRVHSDVRIDVTLFPAAMPPRSWLGALHESQVHGRPPLGFGSWRWPPRT